MTTSTELATKFFGSEMTPPLRKFSENSSILVRTGFPKARVGVQSIISDLNNVFDMRAAQRQFNFYDDDDDDNEDDDGDEQRQIFQM